MMQEKKTWKQKSYDRTGEINMKKYIFTALYISFCILLCTGCGAQTSQEAVPEDAEIALETTTVDSQEYYLLTTGEELRAIGEAYPLSGNYMLANDIIMSGEWSPIGNSENPFTGIFDGNGYTIDGLTAAPEANGFFGVAKDSVIRNVVLENATFDGFFPMVHHSSGTEIEGCSINAGTQAQKE